MAYFGYDPKDYLFDFSRFGNTIGSIFRELAFDIPEIIRYNKEIKENKMFKEKLYDSTLKYIDSIDDNIVSNIVSSMGNVELTEDIKEARDFLKSKVPVPSESQTNEEYANNIESDFYIPFLLAAQSNKGGGSISIGQLLVNVPGVISEKLASTETVGELLKTERDIDRTRALTDISLQKQREQYETQYELEQIAGKTAGSIITRALQESLTPEDVRKKVIEYGGTEEMASRAVNEFLNIQREKFEREKYYDLLRSKQITKDEVKSVDDIDKLYINAYGVLGRIEDNIRALESKKKNKEIPMEVYYRDLADLRNQQAKAKYNLSVIEEARAEFLASEKRTDEEWERIRKEVEIRKNMEQVEKTNMAMQLVKKYNELGNKKYAKTFIEDYTKLMGVPPVFLDKDKKVAAMPESVVKITPKQTSNIGYSLDAKIKAAQEYLKKPLNEQKPEYTEKAKEILRKAGLLNE